MLLTISTTHTPATDLGYLLAKNPANVFQRELSFGEVRVFYPEASDERCTAALMIDLDALTLVKGKEGTKGGGALDDYVNDRPYVASSFMAQAIREAFATALSGKSKERPELAVTPIPLTVTVSALPCHRGAALIERLFQPLGYEVTCERLTLDDRFPGWGESHYYKLTLAGTATVRALLSQLYVLLPVLDNSKHYQIAEAEVAKLLKHGDGWLDGHPARDLIVKRYLRYQQRLVDAAVSELDEPEQGEEGESGGDMEGVTESGGESEGDSESGGELAAKRSLHEQRHDEVLAVLREVGARRVIDLGCGGGKFLKALVADAQFAEIVGMEVSQEELVWAKRRLNFRRLEAEQPGRVKLMQGSLTYGLTHLAGYDAAALIEVIEHIDPPRLEKVVAGIFGDARPGTVVITTPNREYNVRYPFLKEGEFRHRDHRFEWTREEFRRFSQDVAARYAYTVSYRPVGEVDPEVGPSSQLAVFTRVSDAVAAKGDSDLPEGEALLKLERLAVPLAQTPVFLRRGNVASAFEMMSRYTIDPRWLIYLPPTMSPVEAMSEGPLLEHPAQAFAYFARHGVRHVVMEEKHMGSRAVVVACRSAEAAKKRFGVTDGKQGVCYTRTGQPFFRDEGLEAALIAEVAAAIEKSGLWSELNSDWMLIDCELMPWSAKAQGLIRKQYAALASAGDASLKQALSALQSAKARGVAVADLIARQALRLDCVERFRRAYRGYCWPVETLSHYRLAPFHLLATEGAVHTDKDHVWHMKTLGRIAEASSGIVRSTSYLPVDLANPQAMFAAIQLWKAQTEAGAEGMVVKPLQFIVQDEKGLVQPGVKVRGREYLRIIYGPEYCEAHQIERLRKRNLSGKRALAVREFALGHEALQRFVAGQPLASVHECVFGVLALECEPMDPRL